MLKIKRQMAGLYLITDQLGRVYEAGHCNEDGCREDGCRLWQLHLQATGEWMDTCDTLRECKETVETWAARDTGEHDVF